jgi:hypothetical protein
MCILDALISRRLQESIRPRAVRQRQDVPEEDNSLHMTGWSREKLFLLEDYSWAVFCLAFC